MGEAKRRRAAGFRPLAVDMKTAIKAFGEAARASRGIRLAPPLFPLSDRVTRLCARESEHALVMLPFTDVGEGYKPSQCHTNVKHYARLNGGRALGGWIVWENPGWAELEAHAVWLSPKGELIDVTPRPDGEELIMFLPDPKVGSNVLADRQIIYANRSSIPGCPYLAFNRPVPSSTIEALYDPATRKEMQRLGVIPPEVDASVGVDR